MEQGTPNLNMPTAASTTAQPVMPAQSARPVQPEKKSKTTLILGILAGVLAVVAIVFAVLYFTKSKTSAPADGTADGAANAPGKTVVVDAMAEEYREVYDLVASIADGVEDPKYITSGTGLPHKPEGLNTYIPTRFDINLRLYNDANNVAADLAAVKSGLSAAGFTATGELPFFGSAGLRLAGYAKDDIVCGMYDDLDENISFDTAILSCAKNDWGWLTEEEYELTSELETAYFEKEGEYPRTMTGFSSKVKNSKYEPYQTLQVAIGGGYALFYRVSPEAEWQYFVGGQAALACSDYDTDDLKKAFAGDVCWDEATGENSTVQL